MAMENKERKDLVADTTKQLEEVLPASGKPEELVRLTTQIVQNVKKLLEATPEDLRVKSTATLSDFVVAARIIAKDPRSADGAARQRLSSSRRAVEALLKELDSWHDAREPKKEVKEDAVVVLNRLVSEPPPGLPGSVRPSSNSSAPSSTSSTPGAQDDGKEKRLRGDLQVEQIALWKKTEPQQAPTQHGDPSNALTDATGELQKAGRGMVDVAGQKSPLPFDLLVPTLRLSRAVSKLLDIVDSLFVNRYPMRSQVHNFSCTLVEKALSYGSGTKTEDLASLRVITTEVPALLSTAEVMISQSHKRAQDIVGSRKLSMQRSTDFHNLDSVNMMAVKKRGPPPKPPAEKKEEPQAEFEIVCVVCTNVAFNPETKKPVPKGTEIPLLAYPSTSILDIRRMLSTRTGIARDSIEIKMQGDDAVPDSTRARPNNPVPYFMFNIHEPSEDELKEIRRLEKIRSKPRLEDVDWSQYTGAVAVALYEYETLGEEGNLNFDEGDVVEIIEKSADGWWTGRIEDQTGDFPASFVEEIQIPQTKEERKRLAQRFQKRSPTDKHTDSGFSEALESRGSSNQRGNEDDKEKSSFPRVFKKLNSTPDSSSPSMKSKFDRRTSEPMHLLEPQGSKRDKKKLGIFKKRGSGGGGSQHEPIMEERGAGILPKPRSPLLSTDRKFKTSGSLDEDAARADSPETGKRPLVKPAASPRVGKKKPGAVSGGADGSPGLSRPRRPPPPVPKPPSAAVTAQRSSAEGHFFHSQETISPTGDFERSDSSQFSLSLNPNARLSKGSIHSHPSPTGSSHSPELQDVFHSEPTVELKLTPPTSADDSVKKSESMEELLKNLEEFDEVISSQPEVETLDVDRERDFATIPRSELPVKKSPAPEITAILNTPESVRKPRPILPPKPAPVQNGISNAAQKEREKSPSPSPVAPPRKKKPNRMSKKMKDKASKFEEPTDTAQTASSSQPPPKPERDEKKRMRTRLEVMLEKQVCTSAPVSRNVSPDNIESNLKKESSVSTEALSSRTQTNSSSSLVRPALSAAHKCIVYLSQEDRIASQKLFLASGTYGRQVDVWLKSVDRGEDPDLSSLSEPAAAANLLRSLLMPDRLGPIIPYPLAKAMCDLVKSASPVSVLGTQLEQLSKEIRILFKELLRMFGLVITHSHKNHTEVSELNRLFGPALFERVPANQSEPLLAYLISTCELVLAT